MIRSALLLVTGILLAPALGTAAEQPRGEQLLFAEPKGWQEVYADREGNLSTTEYVPEAQSADDWSEMLTVQIVLDTPDADPEAMLSRVAYHLSKSCPDFRVQPIELGGTGSYPTLAVMLMCGKHPETGRGEFSLLRGIAGKTNFFLLQKTWRTTPYRTSDEEPPVALDERKFWLGYLSFLMICDPALGNCPRRGSR